MESGNVEERRAKWRESSAAVGLVALLMGILIAAALFGAVTMMLPPLEAVELPPVSHSTE
jgi:hypothetical protein